MNYEERRLLKFRISEIQREKEERARRMHVKDAYGERLYLGGDSRAHGEQVRSGYPHPDDSAEGKRGKVQTRYICGCDWRDPNIQRYGATVLPDGNITNKRYDREGYEICPIHGARLQGWASTGRSEPPIGSLRGPVPKGGLGSEIPDRRDPRDPATVGEEWLQESEEARRAANGALSKPHTIPRARRPVTDWPQA